jgi:hypothetical protein
MNWEWNGHALWEALIKHYALTICMLSVSGFAALSATSCSLASHTFNVGSANGGFGHKTSHEGLKSFAYEMKLGY